MTAARVTLANRDQAGIVVRSGHTVNLGASVGLVEHVNRDWAAVHWVSGATSWVACSRLTVNRALGRLRSLRSAA